MKAIVLLVVEPNKIDDVSRKLAKIPEVTKVYEVTGEFDVLIELEFESIDVFSNILKNQILKINGIKMTQSSLVLSEWK